ncbi:MAG: preprotein translocase subunit SecE [Candidatus Magasanikbacteria bacterium]|nr:preprotein translocase subunit SecE [Candidatus Magasanikbacteria bacterium]
MNIVASIKNYLIGSYAEMKKVTWPTKQQTINYSLLVIGLSIGMAVFFAVLDYVFNLGITTLITK